jgi:hypothetical protein
VLGAFAFVLLDELATPWGVGRSMIFGTLLVIVVFAFPRGITGAFIALAQVAKSKRSSRLASSGPLASK